MFSLIYLLSTINIIPRKYKYTCVNMHIYLASLKNHIVGIFPCKLVLFQGSWFFSMCGCTTVASGLSLDNSAVAKNFYTGMHKSKNIGLTFGSEVICLILLYCWYACTYVWGYVEDKRVCHYSGPARSPCCLPSLGPEVRGYLGTAPELCLPLFPPY